MSFNKKEYDQKYQKDNYDRIPLNVKRGDKKIISEYAKSQGFDSVTEYIKTLIYTDMNNKKNNISIGDINQNGNNNSINIG